mgnify:CR=1 FL=1
MSHRQGNIRKRLDATRSKIASSNYSALSHMNQRSTRCWQVYTPQHEKECEKNSYRNNSKLQRRRATAGFKHFFTDLEPHNYKRISDLRLHITPRSSRHPARIWSISASSISFPALHKSRSAKASVNRSLMLLSEFSKRLKLLPCVSSCGNLCFSRAFNPHRSQKNSHTTERHHWTHNLTHFQRHAKTSKPATALPHTRAASRISVCLSRWLHIAANAHYEKIKKRHTDRLHDRALIICRRKQTHSHARNQNEEAQEIRIPQQAPSPTPAPSKTTASMISRAPLESISAPDFHCNL